MKGDLMGHVAHIGEKRMQQRVFC